MKIEMTDDAVPHAVTTAGNIPFCWREDVRLQLHELMAKDIIEPVEHPTDWCHPAQRDAAVDEAAVECDD